VPEGALILKVLPNSPAQKAGLRGTRSNQDHELVLGDVIVAIDGKPVTSASDLFDIFDGYRAGDTGTITYLRNGERQQTKAALAVID
jgi:S1-C subfamily serine protease